MANKVFDIAEAKKSFALAYNVTNGLKKALTRGIDATETEWGCTTVDDITYLYQISESKFAVAWDDSRVYVNSDTPYASNGYKEMVADAKLFNQAMSSIDNRRHEVSSY